MRAEEARMKREMNEARDILADILGYKSVTPSLPSLAKEAADEIRMQRAYAGRHRWPVS